MVSAAASHVATFLLKVRVIGHVARNRRVVAEDLVFNHVLACLHGLEEIGNVIGCVVVSLRRGIRLHLRQRRRRLGMRGMPLSRYFCLASAVQPFSEYPSGCGRVSCGVTVSVLPLIVIVASFP